MLNFFSDRATFMQQVEILNGGRFHIEDLAFDEMTGTLTLRVTGPPAPRKTGLQRLLRRKPSWPVRVLTLRGIRAFKRSFTSGSDSSYVFDRAEVERDGTEVTLYFRPGDRAVATVSRPEGEIMEAGYATSIPGKPAAINPLYLHDPGPGVRRF